MCSAERVNTLKPLFCQTKCLENQEVSVASLTTDEGLAPTHSRATSPFRITLKIFLHQMDYFCNVVDITM